MYGAAIIPDNTVGGTNAIRISWATSAPHVPYTINGHVGGAANGPFHNGLLYIEDNIHVDYLVIYPNDGSFIDPAASVVRVHVHVRSAP